MVFVVQCIFTNFIIFLQAKLNGDQDASTESKSDLSKGDLAKATSKSKQQKAATKIQKVNTIPCQCDAAPSGSGCERYGGAISSASTDPEVSAEARQIASDIIGEVVARAVCEAAPVEIDCTEPEIRVSPKRRSAPVETVEIGIGTRPQQQNSSTPGSQSSNSSSSSSTSRRQRVRLEQWQFKRSFHEQENLSD